MKILLEKKPNYRKNKKVHFNEPFASLEMKRKIIEILNEDCLPGREIILLCIGTDRSTGDAFGPLTGTELKRFSIFSKNKGEMKVYGNLKEPVHAVNLEETKSKILQTYKNPYIIAIDAGLGKNSSVGTVEIGKGPLKPGSGVKKDLGTVGHMHLTGYVNIAGFMEYYVLQSTRLSLVMEMSKVVSISLSQALWNWIK